MKGRRFRRCVRFSETHTTLLDPTLSDSAQSALGCAVRVEAVSMYATGAWFLDTGS
jgi:hypothetical protein